MELLQDCPRCQKPIVPKLSYCKACGLPLNKKSLARLALQQQAGTRGDDAAAGQDYLSAFSYPLRGSGLSLLVVGSLCFGIAGMLPMGGLMSLLITGYMAAYMFKIINETAIGNLEPAEWPGFTNIFDDILIPLFQYVFVHIICFVPMILSLYVGVGMTGLENLVNGELGGLIGTLLLSGLLGLGGLAYLPLALLSVALNNSVLGVHPGIVFRLMAHLGKEYLIVLGVLFLSVLLNVWLQGLLGGIPFVGGLIASGVGLYTTMVYSHILGLIYYRHQASLRATPT